MLTGVERDIDFCPTPLSVENDLSKELLEYKLVRVYDDQHTVGSVLT